MGIRWCPLWPVRTWVQPAILGTSKETFGEERKHTQVQTGTIWRGSLPEFSPCMQTWSVRFTEESWEDRNEVNTLEIAVGGTLSLPVNLAQQMNPGLLKHNEGCPYPAPDPDSGPSPLQTAQRLPGLLRGSLARAAFATVPRTLTTLTSLRFGATLEARKKQGLRSINSKSGGEHGIGQKGAASKGGTGAWKQLACLDVTHPWQTIPITPWLVDVQDPDLARGVRMLGMLALANNSMCMPMPNKSPRCLRSSTRCSERVCTPGTDGGMALAKGTLDGR